MCEKSANNTENLDGMTDPHPPRKKSTVKRFISGILMGSFFFAIVYFGVPTMYMTCFGLQIKCVDEVLKIGYNLKKIQEIPFFHALNWYLLMVANYFLFGETFIQHGRVYLRKYYLLDMLSSYHRFISFCFYFIGLVWFVVILRKKILRQQFSLLFWTHFLLIVITAQACMIMQAMYEGIIWLIMSIWLVSINDSCAFIFGKHFGKTPLIRVSPKKTLEGFILGGICTIILGAFLSHFLCHFKYLVCPIKFASVDNEITYRSNCTPSYNFQPIAYAIGDFSVNYYPFMKHSFYLSIFASVIAPFGGFCASGFKRAVGVKDFADTVPGHGGILDRGDCQYLMMTFVNVYIMTFVKDPNVEEIFRKIAKLSDEQQLEFYSLLRSSLSDLLAGDVGNTSKLTLYGSYF
ncbi:unnamed protein product [Phyllotreta striolata]|uniref:phosphatidate cytidylyltransferase n=1 Tax=Phyllotreta striolata TaxID=444603 RepID=A0A9N9TRU8_PHYSR|nr:unnamed protein product [Phyllotreta striolata]